MAELHLPHGGGAQHPADANPAVHHEESDVNVRAILAFAAALVVTAVIIHLLVWVLFRYFNAREAHQPQPEYPLAIQQEQRLPPEPRLQTNPREDLRVLRAAEDDALTTYGWVDRSAGVVRIPIEDAMRITIERGLPSRPAARGQNR
jgi:hypothetical protein